MQQYGDSARVEVNPLAGGKLHGADRAPVSVLESSHAHTQNEVRNCKQSVPLKPGMYTAHIGVVAKSAPECARRANECARGRRRRNTGMYFSWTT